MQYLWLYVCLGIVAFTIWGEYGSQDCRSQQCINRVEKITHEDDEKKARQKLIRAINNNHKLVVWRRVICISMILAIIILYVYSKQKIHGFKVFLISFFIFIVLYALTAHHMFTQIKTNDEDIVSALEDINFVQQKCEWVSRGWLVVLLENIRQIIFTSNLADQSEWQSHLAWASIEVKIVRNEYNVCLYSDII